MSAGDPSDLSPAPLDADPAAASKPARRSGTWEIRGPAGSLPVREGDAAAVDLAMLIEGETSGHDLDEVLERYQRSRSTYYEKLRRFREAGLEGLFARPPGPRSPWRRPVEVLRFIVTTRLRHPEQSAAQIVEDLKRSGHSVSVRSVERTLSQFGLTRRGSVPPTRED